MNILPYVDLRTNFRPPTKWGACGAAVTAVRLVMTSCSYFWLIALTVSGFNRHSTKKKVQESD